MLNFSRILSLLKQGQRKGITLFLTTQKYYQMDIMDIQNKSKRFGMHSDRSVRLAIGEPGNDPV